MPVVPASGVHLQRAFPWWPPGAAEYMGFVFDKIATARMTPYEVEEMFQKTTFGKFAHAFRYAENVMLLRLRDDDPIIVLECELPTPSVSGPEPTMGVVLRSWVSDDSEALLDFVRFRGVFSWSDLQAAGLPALYEVQQRWVKWAYADALEGVPPWLPHFTEQLAAQAYAQTLEAFLDRLDAHDVRSSVMVSVKPLAFNAGVRLTARESWARIYSHIFQVLASTDCAKEYSAAIPPHVNVQDLHSYGARACALSQLPQLIAYFLARSPSGDFAARAATEMQLILQTTAGRNFRAPDHFMWRSWRSGEILSEDMRRHHGYADAPLARVRRRPDGMWEEVTPVVGDFK